MLKIRILILILTVFASGTMAQEKIIVQGTTPSLYLVHTVEAGETWYSLGRTYNVNPKELVQFNNTSMTRPLVVGQSVKLPLTATNFSQDGTRKNDEVFVPLYHFVQEKEWMYRISVNHNKVPIENLEKWNSTSNDQIRPGMALVVGFLKVKTAQSSLARFGIKKIAPVPVAAPLVKESIPAPAVSQPEENKTAAFATQKEEPKKEPIKSDSVPPQPIAEEKTASAPSTPVINHKGGYFKSQYHKSGSELSGNAGIFRSTSGWSDGKYYALMNDVPVGTIIKVSFSSTNKSIYAKVLGQMPEIKESVGLAVRLSDAAASELGASLNKFYVEVQY